MDDAAFGEIRAALDEYRLLVLHDQTLDDERQIAFSRRFGPLQTTGSRSSRRCTRPVSGGSGSGGGRVSGRAAAADAGQT